LSISGQVRHNAKGKPTPASIHAVNLKFLSQPIYCERSNRDANPYLIRVLQKEKADREAKNTEIRLRNDIPAKNGNILPVNFNCLSLSCGIWSYNSVGSDVIYSPKVHWKVGGSARFGDRAIILRLDSKQRIEFRYSSINEITTESGRSPSLIISMMEPPRFFEEIDADPLAELFAKLNLSHTSPPQVKRNGPSRYRLAYLTEEHEMIAGHCLVYKIDLDNESEQLQSVDVNSEKLHLLRQAHGVPTLISRHIEVVRKSAAYEEYFRTLHRTLEGIADRIPFALQFQIQKLAQNNYLSPSKVMQLLPEIIAIRRRSSLSICISAVRKLSNQIGYPGPNAEGQNFLLQTLIGLLRDNEQYYKGYGTSLDEAITEERSENVVIIHRAKITPTSILLSGPAPETTNRVLRKYPNNHDSFLRVTFCDEDGQPIRFSSRVSQERIFNGRFKHVLNHGITIGSQVFTFLGFSHSSLRSQTCWFMAPFIYNNQLLHDRMVIRELGDFSTIFSPAKCAARIGQVFSDTPTTVKIDPHFVFTVDDVEREGRVFSDGVGSMSKSVMEKIWENLSNNRGPKPTCYQIRIAGKLLTIRPRKTASKKHFHIRGLVRL